MIIEALLGEGMDVNYQVRSYVHFRVHLIGGRHDVGALFGRNPPPVHFACSGSRTITRHYT